MLFEGLRLGSTQAFEELLAAEDAAMRRLARLYVPETEVAALLRHTWAVALPGLDMFTWHTTLRAWLTGILVTYGRAARSTGPRSPSSSSWSSAGAPVAAVAARAPTTRVATATAAVPTPPTASTDPIPWSSLGWSGLWSPAGWDLLEAALAARPLPEREVLWLHDVEGWSWREVLDALGLTAAQGEALRHRGRDGLARTVAVHLGEDLDDPARGPGDAGSDERERLDGVAALLSALRPRQQATTADPGLVRTFTAWRRRRGVAVWRRWRWEVGRVRPGRPWGPPA